MADSQDPQAQEPVYVQEEVQTQEPQAQEPVAELQSQEPVEQVQEPVPVQEEVQTQEPVADPQAQEPVAPQDPFHPATHEEIESLHLFFSLKHFISERLLVRAMHSLLDVVPNAWEWAANVDVHNVNQGVDPVFDTILQHMNSQTNFKYDVTWETKPVLAWIIRQLNYIAKHGVSQFKLVYSDFQLSTHIEGLWVLESDPTEPTEAKETEI